MPQYALRTVSFPVNNPAIRSERRASKTHETCVDGNPLTRLGLLQGIDQEVFMRNAVLALLAASGLAMAGSVPAEAVGTRYPFCIQGDEFPGLSNCTFRKYEQCQD